MRLKSERQESSDGIYIKTGWKQKTAIKKKCQLQKNLVPLRWLRNNFE